MSIFSKYARYYDLFNREKNYASETNFIQKLITEYSGACDSILELGCGTGGHALELANAGYQVTGIDLSEHMIKLAKEKNEQARAGVQFLQGDIRNIDLGKKFDVLLSLFHVLSYQTKNDDLIKTFTVARSHLGQNGVLIFDCWYGPAVLGQGPEVRSKSIAIDDVEVTRKANPVLKTQDNVVDVNYTFEVKDSRGDVIDRYVESHSMRYFFIPELEYLLSSLGFKVVKIGEWLTGNDPTPDNWSIYIVATVK
jgi:SAM-dependent methyltransferase